MFRFTLLLILLIVLPDLFIWWHFTRVQPGVWRTLLLLAPTAIALLCMLLLVCHIRVPGLMQLGFLILVCVSVPKLVFLLTAGTGKVLTLCGWNAGGMAVHIGIVLAVATACVQIYGASFGWRRLQVNRHTLHLQGLPPAFEGYKVVQISDLHLGSYHHHTAFVERLVDSVNAQQPDLIVFTGDLVNTEAREAQPFVQVLQRLHARDGVLSVLGNHDYMTYQPGLSPKQQHEQLAELVAAQQRMGWQVLRNEHRAVVRQTDTLFVAGVENIGKPPFPSRGNLAQSLRGIPSSACIVLLSHDPWHWRNGVLGHKSIALTLSGHTHAMQMQFYRFSPARWLMTEWGGLYSEGHQQLYVSTGIGGSVPYRLGAWPQIELFTLHSAKH
ncbi:MAG: metallophosphoesterase [Alloprevotella sp.]